jgi:hypothetical protein
MFPGLAKPHKLGNKLSVSLPRSNLQPPEHSRPPTSRCPVQGAGIPSLFIDGLGNFRRKRRGVHTPSPIWPWRFTSDTAKQAHSWPGNRPLQCQHPQGLRLTPEPLQWRHPLPISPPGPASRILAPPCARSSTLFSTYGLRYLRLTRFQSPPPRSTFPRFAWSTPVHGQASAPSGRGATPFRRWASPLRPVASSRRRGCCRARLPYRAMDALRLCRARHGPPNLCPGQRGRLEALRAGRLPRVGCCCKQMAFP